MPSPPTSATEVEVLATYDSSKDLGGNRKWTPDKRMQLGPVGHIADERQSLLDRSWEHFDADLGCDWVRCRHCTVFNVYFVFFRTINTLCFCVCQTFVSI